MNKKLITTYVWILMIFSFTIQVNAQATNFINEDFSGDFPPAGWTIDGQANQWSKKQTNNAGGEAPEARLKWINGNSSTYFISPQIDLTGIETVFFTFKHFLDDYSGTGYTIGVATKSSASSDWNTVWEVSPTGNMGPETVIVPISNDDTGQADFQVALFLEGNFYNFDYWYIDDLSLYQPANLDLAVTGLNMNTTISQGLTDVSVNLFNMGIVEINSFDISYQVDDNEPVTESVSGIEMNTGENYEYTFTTQWDATIGDHNLDINISNINGIEDDETENNNFTQTISVATYVTTNMPLFEEFTSSTCNPCASFNNSTLNPFISTHDDIAVIKYQMNWPGSGDPYYTDEGGVRRGYYNVMGVPTLFIGGEVFSGNLNGVYEAELNKPSFFEITPNIEIDGNVVSVNVDIEPYVSTTGSKVYIAVVEKMTTGNVATNGETEFHYVMMKMLPDANGTPIDFTSGTNISLSYSHDMSDTNVEEMYDLMVVAFIQNDNNKEVYQAAKAELDPEGINESFFNDIHIYPNPSTGIVNLKNVAGMSVIIYNLLGEKIYSNNELPSTKKVDLSAFPNGIYMMKLMKGDKFGYKKLIINK